LAFRSAEEFVMHGRLAEFACRHSSLAGCGELGAGASSWKPFPMPNAPTRWSRDRTFDVRHLRIAIDVDPAKKSIAGTVTHTIRPFLDDLRTAEFDCAELEVSRVTANGRRCTHRVEGGKLVVELPAPARRGRDVDVAVTYSGRPRRGLYFIAPDEDRPDRRVEVWSQGQDEDSRYWFPCVDYPNEKQSTEVIATVPAGMKALSNGRMLKHTKDARRRTETFHWRLDFPHVAYLVTLVVGRFDVFETKWRGIPVTYWAPEGRLADVKRTLARTPQMMTHFSEKTGVAYPYPQYAQVYVQEFIFGGMENTSATTLTDSAIMDRWSEDEAWMDGLVAHELAHQWFGDYVTCRDWSHGWLNEGFATFMETVWKRESGGEDEVAYYRMGEQEAYLAEDSHSYRRSIVWKRYHDPIEIFDRHLYQKGACVLHMLHEELGEDLFWHCIRTYLERHAKGSVVTDDLRRAIEDVTGRNLEWFFEQWVMKGGHPDLAVSVKPGKDSVAIRIEQKQQHDELTSTFRFRIGVRVETDKGAVSRTLEVTESAQSFDIPVGGKVKWVAVDPGAHLLHSGKVDQSEEGWTQALASDRDGVTRVRAARALVEGATPAGVKALAKALATDKVWFVRCEAAAALGRVKTAAARDALAAAVKQSDPRVLRAVAAALGGFRHDDDAAAALAKLLSPSQKYPGVLHDAAVALGRTRVAAAYERLLGLLERPSWNDMAKRGALNGLGMLRDDRALPVVLAESGPSRTEAVRASAAHALTNLGLEKDADRDAVRGRLEDLVRTALLRTQLTAAGALAERREDRSIGVLHAQAACDLDGRVKRACKVAAATIASGRDRGEDVRKLREDLGRVEDENRRLKDRVEKLEAKKRA
jgi:aminopeptidase N